MPKCSGFYFLYPSYTAKLRLEVIVLLKKYSYQTQIVFQQLEFPITETLLCGIDIGYSGIKIQSPYNAPTIPSIVVKERHDASLLVGSDDIRYREEKG